MLACRERKKADTNRNSTQTEKNISVKISLKMLVVCSTERKVNWGLLGKIPGHSSGLCKYILLV